MKPVSHASLRVVLSLIASVAMPALAANECSVQYGYHTLSGMTRQDQTQTVTMNAGQTLSVNRSNMNFVRSTGTNKVDVTLQGAIKNNFTLDKDKRDPGVGYYLSAVTLVKLFCTQGASAVSPSTPELLIAQLKQANTAVAQIAQQLKSTFNQTGEQVATLLKAAGYTTSQIAGALVTAFNATGAQVAAWLKAAGYTGEQVAAALKSQFNATATQAAAWLKSAFEATGAQVAVWLKAAGYTGEQVAAALKAQFNASADQVAAWLSSAFNASAQQLAQWLRGAGYTLMQVAQALDQLKIEPAQAMAAVRQAFNVSWTEIVNAYRGFVAALQPGNCGAAGCNQGAQILRVAGAKADEALKALKDIFSLNASAAGDIARTVFGLSGQAVDTALAAAGYVVTATSTTVAQSMELNHALYGTYRNCGTYPSGYTLYGPQASPMPMPNTNVTFTITLMGNAALASASAITGWPAGTSYTIRERGPCFLIVDFSVPTTASVGTTGQASVMSGSIGGPRLPWTVGPIPSRAGTPINTLRSTPSAIQGSLIESTLYRVGTATTTDENGDNYTLLETGSPHCQDVASPNPGYTATGAQRANRRDITVPPIGWQVRNGGTTVANVTAELVKGTQVLAVQNNITINPGRTIPLPAYSRPQNRTCVAKLGLGGECYHCGQSHQGWNDTGVFVRIR